MWLVLAQLYRPTATRRYSVAESNKHIFRVIDADVIMLCELQWPYLL